MKDNINPFYAAIDRSSDQQGRSYLLEKTVTCVAKVV